MIPQINIYIFLLWIQCILTHLVRKISHLKLRKLHTIVFGPKERQSNHQIILITSDVGVSTNIYSRICSHLVYRHCELSEGSFSKCTNAKIDKGAEGCLWIRVRTRRWGWCTKMHPRQTPNKTKENRYYRFCDVWLLLYAVISYPITWELTWILYGRCRLREVVS